MEEKISSDVKKECVRKVESLVGKTVAHTHIHNSSSKGQKLVLCTREKKCDYNNEKRMKEKEKTVRKRKGLENSIHVTEFQVFFSMEWQIA